jgi:REP element-mobilizing transposase RayT
MRVPASDFIIYADVRNDKPCNTISRMSRLRRIEQRDRFFFVTTNLARDVDSLSPAERTRVLEILGNCRARLDLKIFAYAVMPDHAHFLLEPMNNTLSSVMRQFKSHTGLALNKSRANHGPLWQSRFFDFICRRARDFSAKMEYINRNPVEAGLARQPEDYPWSSAAAWIYGDLRHTQAPVNSIAAAVPRPQGSADSALRYKPILPPDFIDMPADGDTLLWPAPWR